MYLFILIDAESVELRQLIYFEAVVRHDSFTRAAQYLHVAQPSISAQIRRLEEELDVELLTRTTRRMRLTEAGEVFLVRVRRVLQELDAARADLDDLSGVLRGQVRLGAVDALGPFDLHGALKAFHDRYPGVRLELRSAPVGQLLLSQLDAGDLDLALSPAPPDLPDRYVAHQLFSEELVIIASPQHAVAQLPVVAVATLRDEPFVSFPQATGLRRILEQTAGAAGFTPNVPFESTDLHRIRGLVSAGLGLALVARSIAEGPGPPVVARSLSPERVHRAIGLIQLAGHRLSPAAQACWQILQHRDASDPSST